MQWQRHPLAPWVVYAFQQLRPGTVAIHAKCEYCGDTFYWECIGGAQRAGARVGSYALMHSRCQGSV